MARDMYFFKGARYIIGGVRHTYDDIFFRKIYTREYATSQQVLSKISIKRFFFFCKLRYIGAYLVRLSGRPNHDRYIRRLLKGRGKNIIYS